MTLDHERDIDLSAVVSAADQFPSVVASRAARVPTPEGSVEVALAVQAEGHVGALELRRLLWEQLGTSAVTIVLVVDGADWLPVEELAAAVLADRPHPSIRGWSRYRAPSTELERKMSDLWSEIIDLPDIGLDDNFLDMGADSVAALCLVEDAADRLGISIEFESFFDAPTIAAVLQQASLSATDEASGGD